MCRVNKNPTYEEIELSEKLHQRVKFCTRTHRCKTRTQSELDPNPWGDISHPHPSVQNPNPTQTRSKPVSFITISNKKKMAPNLNSTWTWPKPPGFIAISNQNILY
jgi:hypothetical protein